MEESLEAGDTLAYAQHKLRRHQELKASETGDTETVTTTDVNGHSVRLGSLRSV